MKLFSDTNDYNPPEICRQELNKLFKGIINIEWAKNNELHEATFYKDGFEHIVLLSDIGNLINYKVFLAPEYLPDNLKNHLDKNDEIMNLVLINEGNQIEYEIIYRNKSLDRFLLLVTELGKEIERKKL